MPSGRTLLGFAALATIAATLAYLALGSRASRSDVVAPPRHEEEETTQDEAQLTPAAVEEEGSSEEARAPKAGARREVGGVARAELELEIFDPRGVPCAGVRWALVRDEELLASGAADEHGLARLEASGGQAEMFLLAEGRAPHRETISLAEGRRSLNLPEGRVISGWVVLDGVAPPESFELTLSTRETSETRQLAVSLGKAFDGSARQSVHRLPIPLEPDGAFRFEGLPEVWSGSLAWSQAYRAPQSARPVFSRTSLKLEVPTTNIEIRLVSAASISGRIVTADGSAPVPKAKLSHSWSYENESGHGSMTTTGGSADEDGRFVKYMDVMPASLSLEWADADGAGRQIREFEPSGARHQDLGDLELAPTHVARFVVRDSVGEPVEGAWIAPVDEVRYSPASRTREDGTAELNVSVGIATAQVTAEGYRPAEITIPTGEERVFVVLEAGTVLVVRVIDTAGDVIPTAMLEITGNEGPFWSMGAPSWGPECDGEVHFSSDGAVSGFTRLPRGPQGGFSPWRRPPGHRLRPGATRSLWKPARATPRGSARPRGAP